TNAAFVCRPYGAGARGNHFVRCSTGPDSPRTCHNRLHGSRELSPQKPGTGVSTCGRAFAEPIDHLWQFRITKARGTGTGEHFLSHRANRFPTFAGRQRRREPADHVAKSRRTWLSVARQKAGHLAFAWLVLHGKARLAGVQGEFFSDGGD